MAATTNNDLSDIDAQTSKVYSTRVAIPSLASGNYVIINLDGFRNFNLRHMGFNSSGTAKTSAIKIHLLGTEPDATLYSAELNTIWLNSGEILDIKRGIKSIAIKSSGDEIMVTLWLVDTINATQQM
jgi:hypothetical protein